ncbi:MAG: hypothetical protein P8M30_11830 [Planctomycetaceae bacterium]|jgi:hypothetical protein|nr:hypothetical protein [Planctomycetaceae bacterium]MDG2390000.1 hypothetical protein [Planctomycetaceae bacterium]
MSASINRPLIHEILNQIEAVIIEAEEKTRPLEMQPYRSQLFDLFSTAHQNGLTEDEEGPLAADAICKELGNRWGLSSSAQNSVTENASIPPEHLAKMRSLWSVMRMWMEWNYAWNRWSEFHDKG